MPILRKRKNKKKKQNGPAKNTKEVDKKPYRRIFCLRFIGVLSCIFFVFLVWFINQHRAVQPGLQRFSGLNSLEHLSSLTNVGPRPSQSEASKLSLEMIKKHLESYGWSCDYDEHIIPLKTYKKITNFDKLGLDPSTSSLTIRNLVANYRRIQRLPTIILATHYDTRLEADLDKNEANRKKASLGANNGASGCAVLMELGRVIGEYYEPVERNLRMVFFDFEASNKISPYTHIDWNMLNNSLANTIAKKTGFILQGGIVGSTLYVDSLDLKDDPIDYAIVMDMVGDNNQLFSIESYSLMSAPSIISKIYQTAHRLGFQQQFPTEGSHMTMLNDHYPFIRRGIRAVNLVDFNYRKSHSLNDNLDTIDEKSLDRIGLVIQTFLEGSRVLKTRVPILLGSKTNRAKQLVVWSVGLVGVEFPSEYCGTIIIVDQYDIVSEDKSQPKYAVRKMLFERHVDKYPVFFIATIMKHRLPTQLMQEHSSLIMGSMFLLKPLLKHSLGTLESAVESVLNNILVDVFDIRHVLIVGIAGGEMIRWLNHNVKGIRIDGIDIEPIMLHIAKRYFGLESTSTIRLWAEDGIKYLMKRGDNYTGYWSDSYDVIIIDASMPPNNETDPTGAPLLMRTLEFYKALKYRLNARGIVVINFKSHKDITAQIKIFKASFQHTYVLKRRGEVVGVGMWHGRKWTESQIRGKANKLDNIFNSKSINFRATAKAMQLDTEKKKGKKS